MITQNSQDSYKHGTAIKDANVFIMSPHSYIPTVEKGKWHEKNCWIYYSFLECRKLISTRVLCLFTITTSWNYFYAFQLKSYKPELHCCAPSIVVTIKLFIISSTVCYRMPIGIIVFSVMNNNNKRPLESHGVQPVEVTTDEGCGKWRVC